MKNSIDARRHSVFGIFSDQASLEQAVERLKSNHFKKSDISVLMPSQKEGHDIVFQKHSKAPEGVSTGSATGVAMGGVFGWLLGAGILTVPGLGAFTAAGPIMGAIAGAGLGGTIGGIAGGLIGLGIPEYEAIRFEGFLKEGGLLLTVHVDNSKWERNAKKILKDYGAKNISTTYEKKSEKVPVEKQKTSKYEGPHLVEVS